MNYDDIINLPRPEPKKRMSMHERAAQFSPFAALTGFDEAVDETARKQQEKTTTKETDEYYSE